MSEGREAAIDRLRHMREAADAIVGYTDRGRDAFDNDAAVRDAVVYQTVVLGEAAKAVVQADPTLADALTRDGIEWSLLARMRDRLTHQYWRTDADIVWATATQDRVADGREDEFRTRPACWCWHLRLPRR